MNISPDPQLASINSDIMDRYDKLLLKETKTHNENVELKSKIEELKEEFEKEVKKGLVESMSVETFKEIKKLREENEELKEENEKWEADDESLTKVMSMVSKELGDDEEPWEAVDDIYDIVKKLKKENEKLKKDLKTFKDMVVEALGGPEFNGPYKDCIRSRDIICEIAALKNPNLCDPETGEIIGLKDFGYLKKENEELKKVVKSNRDLFDASEKDVKRLKEQLESTQNSLGSTSAEYEKLVDNSNNDNLNFGDILFEREEEIKRLTKTLQLAEDKIKDLKESDDDCRPDAWDAM